MSSICWLDAIIDYEKLDNDPNMLQFSMIGYIYQGR